MPALTAPAVVKAEEAYFDLNKLADRLNDLAPGKALIYFRGNLAVAREREIETLRELYGSQWSCYPQPCAAMAAYMTRLAKAGRVYLVQRRLTEANGDRPGTFEYIAIKARGRSPAASQERVDDEC